MQVEFRKSKEMAGDLTFPRADVTGARERRRGGHRTSIVGFNGRTQAILSVEATGGQPVRVLSLLLPDTGRTQLEMSQQCRLLDQQLLEHRSEWKKMKTGSREANGR